MNLGTTARCQTNRPANKRLLENQIARPTKIDMLRTFVTEQAKVDVDRCDLVADGSSQFGDLDWSSSLLKKVFRGGREQH